MPALSFSSCKFRYHFKWFFLEQLSAIFNKKVRTVAAQKRNIIKGICDCSTIDVLMQPLRTTVHSFLDLHIAFRVFRIGLRPNWNNNYNITSEPATLHKSQMKRISGSHYFLHLFTNSTPQHVLLTTLCECKLLFSSVLRCTCLKIIFSLIA